MFQYLVILIISVIGFGAPHLALAETSRSVIHIQSGSLKLSDCVLSLQSPGSTGGYVDIWGQIWPQDSQNFDQGQSIQLSLSPQLVEVLMAKKGGKKKSPRQEEDFYRSPYRPGRGDRGRPGRNDSPDRAPDGAPVYYDPSSPSDYDIPPAYLLPVNIYYGGSVQDPEVHLRGWVYLD